MNKLVGEWVDEYTCRWVGRWIF